mmetsp:Transcript_12657/g.24807  ORF Transcript_12657/g.24807 Transcript_12657/m.24807 type:complete len:208 (-) Transcript_12657:406-1029(-)|eukprot:CAMPEP_0172674808 /NCGR_PEP_ID=MMETSP1074-20121228/12933_1 /TAXON_ID=2916 /ORGANISM="Ceratium fusus, Strain PA161109" /LENGTH=207 /DNA_ID=CAMNT_0013492241 /DNA_START=52 /DNA_END=675 /DNA_ORIENTATION=+
MALSGVFLSMDVRPPCRSPANNSRKTPVAASPRDRDSMVRRTSDSKLLSTPHRKSPNASKIPSPAKVIAADSKNQEPRKGISASPSSSQQSPRFDFSEAVVRKAMQGAGTTSPSAKSRGTDTRLLRERRTWPNRSCGQDIAVAKPESPKVVLRPSLAEARKTHKTQVHAVERSQSFTTSILEKLCDFGEPVASCSTSCGSASPRSPI